MAYEKWFVRKPNILEQEITAFREAGLDFRLDNERLQKEQIIAFNGTVRITDHDVVLELIYPAEFPQFPIQVFSNEVTLERHQNPFSKNLCVIPHNQDGWVPTMTGAFMVKQAIRLLEDSEVGPAAVQENEVDAPEPWSNYIEYRAPSLLIPGNIPSDPGMFGTFTIGLYVGQHVFIQDKNCPEIHSFRVLKSLDPNGRSKYVLPQPFDFQERPSKNLTGTWFHLDTAPDFDIYQPENTLSAIEAHIPDAALELEKIRRQIDSLSRMKTKRRNKVRPPQFALLFPEENYERNRFRTTFVLATYDHRTNTLVWSRPQFVSVDEHFSRIPDLLNIHYTSVLLVGVGSLGSAVALELGKSGVGVMTLVDFDALDAGNLVRHTGTIEYIGMPKTRIVANQIRGHFPFCNVTTIHAALGRIDPGSKDDGSFQSLYDVMKNHDLVIDTSADARVSSTLSRFAVKLGVPIIHSWVSNGAWGGRVIKYIPGKTGCFQCFDDSSPEEMSSAPRTEIYPGGCGFPTFAGASFDIYEVATHTVRAACNTLLGKYPTPDHILIQHYPEPFVKTFPILRNPDCPVCGGNA